MSDPRDDTTRSAEHLPRPKSSSGDRATTASFSPPEALPEPVGDEWPIGYALLDEFEVEAVLGRGGMGTVYLVRERSTGHRHAVKRAHVRRPGARRRFLSELQTWIDLPSYPHLARCRFFRTVAEEVIIFADYEAGGSLAAAILQGRVRRGEVVLDVAIQIAWGLHALHEGGWVHQDVKPGNVLLSADGIARVTDFGLARSRGPMPAELPANLIDTSIHSVGGLSPAYCSPEQRARRGVSRKTDIWSWGVTVLEMYFGRVPCCQCGGHQAGERLGAYLADRKRPPTIDPMPACVGEVLQRCFREDPSERWPTLAEAAATLLQVFQTEFGRPFPREVPATPSRRIGPVPPPGRSTPLRTCWDPPRHWLARAFAAQGRDPTEVEGALPDYPESRKAQAVADLTVFDQSHAILDRLVGEGQTAWAPSIAALEVQKALVHSSVGDFAGASEWLDRAITRWRRLIDQEGRRELLNELARTYIHRGNVLRVIGDPRAALEWYDWAIKLGEGIRNQRQRREFRGEHAAALFNKGETVRHLGDLPQAIELYDAAIKLWETIAGSAEDLARAYLAKANAVSALGGVEDPLTICDRSIRILRRLTRNGHRLDLRGELARADATKAAVLRTRGQNSQAIPLLEKAIRVFEQLIQGEGRDEWEPELARAYLGKASAERVSGDTAAAICSSSRAADILERLIYEEGRGELTVYLARTYLQQSIAYSAASDGEAALRSAERSVNRWRELVDGGRSELTNDLARAHAAQARALRLEARFSEALAAIEAALGLRAPDADAELGKDLLSRAEVLTDMGHTRAAQESLQGALQRLKAASSGPPRPDVRAALARAHRLEQSLS